MGLKEDWNKYKDNAIQAAQGTPNPAHATGAPEKTWDLGPKNDVNKPQKFQPAEPMGMSLPARPPMPTQTPAPAQQSGESNHFTSLAKDAVRQLGNKIGAIPEAVGKFGEDFGEGKFLGANPYLNQQPQQPPARPPLDPNSPYTSALRDTPTVRPTMQSGGNAGPFEQGLGMRPYSPGQGSGTLITNRYADGGPATLFRDGQMVKTRTPMSSDGFDVYATGNPDGKSGVMKISSEARKNMLNRVLSDQQARNDDALFRKQMEVMTADKANAGPGIGSAFGTRDYISPFEKDPRARQEEIYKQRMEDKQYALEDMRLQTATRDAGAAYHNLPARREMNMSWKEQARANAREKGIDDMLAANRMANMQQSKADADRKAAAESDAMKDATQRYGMDTQTDIARGKAQAEAQQKEADRAHTEMIEAAKINAKGDPIHIERTKSFLNTLAELEQAGTPVTPETIERLRSLFGLPADVSVLNKDVTPTT